MERLECWHGFVVLCFFYVGAWLTQKSPRARSLGVKLGIVCGVGAGAVLLARDSDPFLALISGIAAAVIATSASWLILAPLDIVLRPVYMAGKSVAGIASRKMADAHRKARDENARKAAEKAAREWKKAEAERLAKLPPPLPEPTAAEKRARLKAKYDQTVEDLNDAGLDSIELQAALMKVKRSYLNELDELI